MAGATELALFALVVETHSFKEAGLQAGLSTAVVSKRISKLERELGAQLLYRTTRRLSLTEEGRTLYQHCKGINQQVQDALGAVSQLSDSLGGTIRMSVPTISGELLLAKVVAEFCQQHPHLNVDMQLDNSLVDLIQEGVDLAIRTAVMDDSSLVAKKLIQSHWVVCCAPGYIRQFGQPQTPAELLEHNCLAYTYQAQGAHDWRFTHRGQSLSIKVAGNFSTNNAQGLRKAALAGCGIVYVPRCSVHEDIQRGDLTPLLHDYQPRSLGVYAVYPFTRYQPKKVGLLIEHIRTAYQELSAYFE
ncbi:LysR family transcriptional regulator [Microbulbifer sp. TYP-18]|uniref:LysR family transcriptional regulator n=1 Tax=Microbulbifer sp. TYP-18 TaxID=3230024 RepID=UPI0034C6B1CF